VAVNETYFDAVERGATSLFKFRIGDEDPTRYVWFEFPDGSGALHTTPRIGPYDPADPLGGVEFETLDTLLTAKGTSKSQWVKDLMAQYGEVLEWTYPAKS
jgi:hypothetical protein